MVSPSRWTSRGTLDWYYLIHFGLVGDRICNLRGFLVPLVWILVGVLVT